MQIDLEDAGEYLAANVSGKYSLDGMLLLIDRIAEESTRLNQARVLVDVSRMTGDAPLSDRYVYAARAAERLLKITKCAACAGVGQQVVPFTSIVAKNRGLQLEVFFDRAEAVQWLRGDP
jgi:hypothetical protein